MSLAARSTQVMPSPDVPHCYSPWLWQLQVAGSGPQLRTDPPPLICQPPVGGGVVSIELLIARQSQVWR